MNTNKNKKMKTETNTAQKNDIERVKCQWAEKFIAEYDEKTITVTDEVIVNYNEYLETIDKSEYLNKLKNVSINRKVLLILSCCCDCEDLVHLEQLKLLLAEIENKVEKIAVSQIRSRKDFDYIKNILKELLYNDVSIGLMVDTETTSDYIDDYFDADFAIIDYKAIASEFGYSLDNEQIGMELCRYEVRDVHQECRMAKVKHYIDLTGYCTDALVKKLLKKGLRNFILRNDIKKSCLEIIQNHLSTRGKYKKPFELFKVYKIQNKLL